MLLLTNAPWFWYEGEKFLGRCLGKINRKVRLQYLSRRYSFRPAQICEKEINVVYHDKVYKPPIISWGTELDDDGKCARETFCKY